MLIDFFQKNKSIIIILLMGSFFVAILAIFISGIAGSGSHPTPTAILPFQQITSVVPTNKSTISTARPGNTQVRIAPTATALHSPTPAPTSAGPKDAGSPPPTVKSSVTDVPPGTDAPPPPTFQNLVTDVPPGTNAPPPPTIKPLPTEAPPAGNGPPPGS
jgi:hypothetical protein